MLEWKVLKERIPPYTGKGRGIVHGFSKASRLRLLKILATVDWSRAFPALFVTLTYPDEVVPRTNKLFNAHRAILWRYIEAFLGRQITAIWRIEYMPRKTGKYVGDPWPHYHIMVFATTFIDCDVVNDRWKKSIGHTGYLRTETKQMEAPTQAGSYVASYCGKVSPSLVNDAYLNKIPTGRQWGILRKPLLPVCEKITARFVQGELTDLGRETAKRSLPYVLDSEDKGFVLFGGPALHISAMMFGILQHEESEQM